MRLASIKSGSDELAAVLGPRGPVTVTALNRAAGSDLPVTLEGIVATERLEDVRGVAARHYSACPAAEPQFAPPLRRPGKIWGIGLNYRDHAADLDAPMPDEPASFMKPRTTIVGNNDDIVIPRQSHRVTAEAEFAIVIGRRCRDVPRADVPDVILGVTPVLDMTAEDILRRNPRFLTRAKSFDTFFSFGPEVVTLEEIGDLRQLTVRTIVNSEVHAQNTVANMAFDPFSLVAFHSQVMTLEPGDIISTGTPGASWVRPGDIARCEIDGFVALENHVVGDQADG